MHVGVKEFAVSLIGLPCILEFGKTHRLFSFQRVPSITGMNVVRQILESSFREQLLSGTWCWSSHTSLLKKVGERRYFSQ